MTPSSGSRSTTAVTSPTARRSTPAAMLYDFVSYKLSPSDERIDLDQVRDLALAHRPKMIVAGATAYPRRIDAEPFRAIADEVDALLLFDIAHIAGLIAGGAHPSPVGIADVVTLTTHKTLRGPRGGAILASAELGPTDRQGHLPRPPGRAAGARHRRQGGGLPGGHAPGVPRLRPPDRGQRRPRWPEGLAGRGLPARLGRHRQPPDAGRPARPSTPSSPARRRRPFSTRPASRSTRTPSPTIPARPSSPAASASARPPVTTQGMRQPEMADHRRADRAGRCATADDAAELAAVREDVAVLCGKFTPYTHLRTLRSARSRRLRVRGLRGRARHDAVTTPIVRRVAIRFGWVVPARRPAGARPAHAGPRRRGDVPRPRRGDGAWPGRWTASPTLFAATPSRSA